MINRIYLSAVLAVAMLPATRGQAPAPADEAPAPAEHLEPIPPDALVLPTEAELDPEVAVVVAEEAPAGSLTRARDTLSVDFPDEDIRNILRNVADLFELNLVIPDTLQGRTSIKLRDVTWRQIFEVVMSPVGFTFIEEGNIIKVVSQDSLAMEPVATDVFIINYARAEDIRRSVEPLVDGAAGGRVIVDARSNALIISERPSRLGRIRPIIEALDKATEQVMIESKFVEVTDRDLKNIGVNWASLNGYQIGASDLGQVVERTRGQERSSGETGENVSSTFNRGGSGTESSTFVTSNASSLNAVTSTNGVTTSTGTTSSGTTLGSNTSTDSNASSGTDVLDTVTRLSSLVNTGATSRIASAVFSASDFNLILSALQTQNQTKLVSNPTVVTLNNTEAQIDIADQYPIPNYTYNQERGTFEVSGFDYRSIGIILKVTPQVNAQGFIRLTLEPEVSSQNGSVNFGGASGTEIPIISTRRARTQVSLKDGYTMGIGGLIENVRRDLETRVPVLGSIPGLGRLFRSNSKGEDSRNLLIFITAKTVDAEGAPLHEVFDPRAIRKMGLREDELPGYRDGTEPFAPMVLPVEPVANRRR